MLPDADDTRGLTCPRNSSPSKLRKKGEAVLDAKYDGKKGSRAAIFGGDDDDDEVAEEGGESEEDEDDENEEEEEMGDFEDLERDPEDDEDEDDEDEDEEIESEDGAEDEAPQPPQSKRKAATAPPSRAKEQDERAMVSQLKQAASADVEKGRAVKKQLVRSFGLALAWRHLSRARDRRGRASEFLIKSVTRG